MASKKSSVNLSNAVKQLIASRGPPVSPAAGYNPASIRKVLDELQQKSPLSSTSVLQTLATGALVTLNAPFALQQLWQWTARTPKDAELLREAGLKCISFIGIAKVINNLGVLQECFQKDGVQEKLTTSSRRRLQPEAVDSTFARGRELWNSIYDPHSKKLIDKLATYHPDLPVHILDSHYSLLLSDPSPAGPLGRTLTSVLAIACLQAQVGVGSQTTSHVFGLKKALLEADGGEADYALQEKDRQWLCGDAGNEWILESIEALRKAVNSSGPPRAKL